MDNSEIKYVDCCWMCKEEENRHNDCWCKLRNIYVSSFAVCPEFKLNEKFTEYKSKDLPYWIETRFPDAESNA